MAGDAEKGVRLTLQGLTMATSDRDRISGWANLCAGYVMLDRLDDALVYCDQAIEADPGHSLIPAAPGTEGRLVVPTVTIDDRRKPPRPDSDD